MESLGVDEVYIDRMSGKNTNRPELQKMMEYVRRGDTVIVESISRFAFFLVPFGYTLTGYLYEIRYTHSGCIPRMGKTIWTMMRRTHNEVYVD